MPWIGSEGSLMEFKCPSAVEVTPADTRVFFRSRLGNVSITDALAGPPPRTWAVEMAAARPQDAALLQALSLGEFGVGPFAWVPPAAETLNLLGRGAAVCRDVDGQAPGVTVGGPLLTSEGWAGRSLVRNAATHIVMGRAPAVGGRVVSARVWCTGTAAQLRFIVSDGWLTSSHLSPTVDAGTGSWVTFSLSPREGTNYVRLDVLGAEKATRPSVTWDAPARLWTPSKASRSVSVQPVPEGLLRATGRAGEETLSRHAFEIQEVG